MHFWVLKALFILTVIFWLYCQYILPLLSTYVVEDVTVSCFSRCFLAKTLSLGLAGEQVAALRAGDKEAFPSCPTYPAG